MSSISVIIPAFNAELYISDSVNSVLHQTRKPAEVVVVDDASTDRTYESASAFGDPVKVIKLPRNSGVGNARNAGVKSSCGDYIAFLDADDILLPDHLTELGGLLDRWPEAGMAVPGIIEVNDIGELTGSKFIMDGDWTEKPVDLFAQAMRGEAIAITGNYMVRRDAFVRVGGFAEIEEWYMGRRVQAEDNDLFLRMSVNAKIIASSRASVLYRRHAAQSSVHVDQQWFMLFKYRTRLIEELSKDGRMQKLYKLGLDRLSMAWEKQLENLWAERKIELLRDFVRYGMRHKCLRPLTWHYLPRCMVASLGLTRS